MPGQLPAAKTSHRRMRRRVGPLQALDDTRRTHEPRGARHAHDLEKEAWLLKSEKATA